VRNTGDGEREAVGSGSNTSITKDTGPDGVENSSSTKASAALEFNTLARESGGGDGGRVPNILDSSKIDTSRRRATQAAFEVTGVALLNVNKGCRK
jgi:hypothetical protein